MTDKPSRVTFLNRLYSALRAQLSDGGFMSAEDFTALFKSARGHAGGKAKADARAMLLAAEGGDAMGCIVCLVPDVETAQALAVEGGLPPEMLHLTLCTFGDTSILDSVQQAEALLAVRDATACMPPLQGEISGIGRFTNGEQDVIYASLDAPELNDLQDCISDCLEMAGLPVAEDHGFTPHITLTYIEREMPSPIEIIEPRPVRFESVEVWMGDQHITLPLLGINAEGDDGEDMGMAAEQLASEPADLADLAAAGHTHRLFNSIAFAEAPSWIPYLPKPGSYAHPRYGTITITTDRNARFVNNFNAGVYQDRLPIDAEHETKLSGATGWITAMRQNSDGSADAKVEWTDRGRAFFQSDRFRYFSPEWYDTWEDPATRIQHKDVAIGGALTTRPFFKDPALRPLFASEGSLSIDLDPDTDPQSQGADMAESTSQFAELEARIAALTTENAALKQAGEAAQAQSTALAEQVQKIAQERQQERFGALIKNNGQRWFGEDAQHLSVLGVLAQTYGEEAPEFKAYIAQQQGIAAALRASKAFEEQGSDGAGRTETTDEKLDRLARERAKAQSISVPQAYTELLDEDPTLYT